MKQEITFEYAREVIRQKLQNAYGTQLHEITDSEPLAQVADSLVMDAYIGREQKIRISIYFNMRDLYEEESGLLYESALCQIAGNPDHIIIVCHMTDEDEVDWIDQDYYNIDKIEGFWVVPGYGKTKETFDEMNATVFRILNGSRFKAGCRTGINKGLTLLMVKAECPECGETLWIPDSILLPAFHTADNINKDWLLSFESIFKYSHQTIAQIADTYNSMDTKLGTMQMNPEYGFRMCCHRCGRQYRDYDKSVCEYFEHEINDEWLNWLERENLDDTVRLLPLNTVALNLADVNMLTSNISSCDGFLFMGIYDIRDFIHKPMVVCSSDELIQNFLSIRRHIDTFPLYQMDLGSSYAEFDKQFIFTGFSSYFDHASELIRSYYSVTE